MNINMFPTKSNLIKARAALQLSMQGYDLLDKKRNILIAEMMFLIKRAEEIQSSIDKVFSAAYRALQRANVSLGISNVQEIGYAIPEEDGVEVRFKSIMGVEIPLLNVKVPENLKVSYSLYNTNFYLDLAYQRFNRVKHLIYQMAEVENTIYRLANHIKKTQKRANALKSIIIPRYKELVNFIQNSLEEKEREEFSRLHVLKGRRSEG